MNQNNRLSWIRTSFLNSGFTPTEIKSWVQNLKNSQRAEYQAQLVFVALLSALLTQYACHWFVAFCASLGAIKLLMNSIDLYSKLWGLFVRNMYYTTIVEDSHD